LGKWKAVREPWIGGELKLYDVTKDIGEASNVAGENPEVIKQVEKYLEEAHVPNSNWKIPTPNKKKTKKPVTS
jgi:hypothetical protein